MTLLATLGCWAVLWLILAAAFYVAGRFASPPRQKPYNGPVSPYTPIPQYHPYPTPESASQPR